MRNLLEYPLTAREVAISLDIAIEDRAAKQYIGDITCVGLHALKLLVQQRPELLEEAAAASNGLLTK